MGRYTLEVVEPTFKVPVVDEEELVSVLDALATVHGGQVVESPGSAPRSRHYVNIFDCETSLKDEVEWLRRRFPDIRFTLKEFM